MDSFSTSRLWIGSCFGKEIPVVYGFSLLLWIPEIGEGLIASKFANPPPFPLDIRSRHEQASLIA